MVKPLSPQRTRDGLGFIPNALPPNFGYWNFWIIIVTYLRFWHSLLLNASRCSRSILGHIEGN